MTEEIDKGIRELIEILNKNGFNTNFSCSGLIEDHKDSDQWGKGYISFLPMTIEKEEKMEEITLSSHMEFCGRKSAKYLDNGGFCIRNGFDEENIIKKSSDFTITNKMKNDLFKTTWELFEEKIIEEMEQL